MDKITLDHNFEHSPPCRINVSYEDVTVQFEGREAARISWGMLDNVEALSDTFGVLQVRVFKQLVAALGAVYAKRATYLTLLGQEPQGATNALQTPSASGLLDADWLEEPKVAA